MRSEALVSNAGFRVLEKLPGTLLESAPSDSETPHDKIIKEAC